MTPGPRIYNLFPLLAGPVRSWADHLPRIQAMGFDWIYVNPFHYPGFSGSLYAVKDYYRLHPLLQDGSNEPPDRLLGDFVAAADGHGAAVMMDLVINHTAKDALLVEQHPEWYRREPDGSLRSPRAVDPVDPRIYTVWGDLAEIEYDRPDLRQAQIDHWAELVRHHLRLGFKGFRCDAAYQVPAEVWRGVIDAARAENGGCLFFAETLGCTPEQVVALADAGFDFIFNSAKWWDFRADWLLDQYERYRMVAPSIAFPESHDTERLACELTNGGRLDDAEVERHYRLRYLFSAAFSSGVMMPMGYEYGFRKKLDVVESRPGDWDFESGRPRFDLTGFVGAVNAMKAAAPALNVEGLQRRITAPHSPVVGLLRLNGGDAVASDSAAITLINPDPGRPHGVDPGPLLAEAGGRVDAFTDVTPADGPAKPFVPGQPITLDRLELRVFAGRAVERPVEVADPKQAQARLMALAANRIVVERVKPELDGGRFPVKRVVGDVLEVSADIFADGHEKLAACVRYRGQGEQDWREAPMAFVDNDRWAGSFPLTRNARYHYTVEAWRDMFETWRGDFIKKYDADQDVGLELIEGRHLVEAAHRNARGADKRALQGVLDALSAHADDRGALVGIMLGDELRGLMNRCAERNNASRYERELEVVVDRQAAVFAAWYEMFPRSQSFDANRHGTFDDVIRRLPYVRDMGFDVLYFTPIHPIGVTKRKGRNNTLVAGPNDPGSVYGIGSEEGGHKDIHPQLGTHEDFRRLVAAAHDHGLEIALDIAFQASRDHPWIKEHPEWFDWRPDGTIKFAENPPKKYEDIVPVHFYRDALPSIWYEARDVFLFWIDQGVRTFRVDNPHTKPFPFWEWCIREVQDRHPDAVFLSEAFTRPKMMKRLAKVGYTQSYTYFTWRNDKRGLTEYLTELTQQEPVEYMRPNFFVNTPDINPPFLQTGGRPAHMLRIVLAGTLSPVYGMYNGYEICEATPVPGKEEYLDSEKYEIKVWDFDRPGNIRDYITRLNKIRRENPALHRLDNLRFYNAWNDNVLVYGKMTAAKDNIILVAVNHDPFHAQGCHFEVPLWELDLPDHASVEVEELFSGHRFTWHGKVQEVWLDPQLNPCAIWRITPPWVHG